MMAAREHREDGTYAVLFALLLVVFFGVAALSVDLADLSNTRQDLHDTLDAAAHAGATHLPDDPVGAEAAALTYAHANDPELIDDPVVDFWCIIGATNGVPEYDHIGPTCEPGAADVALMQCEVHRCYMPCNPFMPGRTCNTIRVRDNKEVEFAFAPVIGTNEGNTGGLSGAACKGNCGAGIHGPLDLVLVLDRTPSMRPQDITSLVGASRTLLEFLDPERHQVALVVHGPSVTRHGCPSSGIAQALTHPLFPLNGNSRWVAVGFRDDFHLSAVLPGEIPVLAGASDLVQGIDCLAVSQYGTDLGDPVYAAAEYLDENGRDGVPGGILFMTDGQPTLPNGNGSTANEADCRYALSRAADARDLGVAIITVAYRLQGVTLPCGNGPDRATELLAEMASDPMDGPPTADDTGCVSPADITTENQDGDHFFCAPGPGELAQVFRDAAIQLTDQVQLVRVPDGA